MSRLATMLCLVLAAGPGVVPVSGAADPEVEKLLAERGAASIRLRGAEADPGRHAEELQALLAKELTAAGAVEVALRNNRSLQASLRELGVSEAELSQALLLKNPVVHGEVRFPGRPMEFGLVQDVTDIFLRPLRRQAASAHLRRAQLEAAHAVLELTAEVRAAFYSLQAAEQVRAMQATITEGARVSADLAQRQFRAGNTSQLMLENGQILYEEARLEMAQVDLEVVEARERLNRLLGLWGEGTGWRVAGALPEVPEPELSGEALESLAVGRRLDLAATEAAVIAARTEVPLARYGQWPAISLGVHLEREPEGRRTIGPEIEIAIPLFDRGQAASAGARVRIEQGLDRQAALAVDIRSEVRSALAGVSAAQKRAIYYRDVVLPRRERIVEQTQREYNFMLVGVYQLIQARRDEIHTRRAHIEAQRDYWLARTELERAVGGSLPGVAR